MDAWKYGKPKYHCHWCNDANFDPSLRCDFCGRWQPGSTYDRWHGHESNVKRSRLDELRAYQRRGTRYGDLQRDNRVDMAGYAETVDMVHDERERRCDTTGADDG